MNHVAYAIMYFLAHDAGSMDICGTRRAYTPLSQSRAVALVTDRNSPAPTSTAQDTSFLQCIASCTRQPTCQAVNVFENGTCERILSLSFSIVPDLDCKLYTGPYACPEGFSDLLQDGSPATSGVKQPSCYLFVEAKRNWQKSRDFCKSQGGDLISVESMAEQYHAQTIISSSGKGGDRQVWTSGIETSDRYKWRWAATGAPFGFSNWGRGEPNRANEKCMALWIRWGFRWNNAVCSLQTHALCETSAIFE